MNYTEKHKEVALKFIKNFYEIKSIEGVLLLGGIARNFADEYSDIDIAIFHSNYDGINGIHIGEKIVDGFHLEIFKIDITKNHHYWDEYQKEAFSQGILVYDKGKTKNFLDNALVYTEKYRLSKIVTLLFKLGWHGLYNQNYFSDYTFNIPKDLWVKRKNQINGIFVLNHCVDLFIDLLFAINYRFTPDYKWKYEKSLYLNFLPLDYKINLKKILTINNFEHNLDLLQKMINECYDKICKVLPPNLYSYLLEEVKIYD
jgi:hypothetical protein